MNEKYDQKMLAQFRDQVVDFKLRIFKRKTLITFKFVEQLNLLGLSLWSCPQVSFTQVPSNITQLSIQSCGLIDIRGIQHMPQLLELNLNSNAIFDISPLKNLSCLSRLCISENKLVNISVIQHLIHLKYLELYGNQIVHVFSAPLKKLEHLYLVRNQIIDFGFVQGHPNKNKFAIEKQTDPNPEIILKSNKLRQIFIQSQQMNQIKRYERMMKEKIILVVEGVNTILKEAVNAQIHFTSKIAHILRYNNQFGTWQ
ncbi:leucine-rich_repeat domain-containing protein [Hexamita inflata]|uniref:Leucine-rich repeat domain-containing protein n=1 Tax=Hexamita inflata TaxID=28002 RepID=A0AA86VAC3_9EUKA|nr:leucine-rich repeat domain-containing protein [Hexamita inflata]